MVLPPEEARRIAAGEVIDRPAALIREFLDNAIDAQAANIEVSIEEGGSKKAEVADDGEGMSREDLELCALTHATSKIRSLEDLNTSQTLGFRGEALSAAAAVARIEIISSTDGMEAWRLETGPGGNYPPKLEQTRRTRGATVRAMNLFDSIPARKRFLKREGSEAALCRQVFIDKVLVFPAISFRFIQDGKLKDFFPAASSEKERFAAAFFDGREAVFLHEINVSGNGFSAAITIGGPELCRSDKRLLYVFANGRRIQDYALVQAMEYGVQGWFPNGTHPVGAVYITIDPSLADFNIHPAKREVRFRDPGAIHHAISSGLRNFCHHFNTARSTTAQHSAERQKYDENSLASQPELERIFDVQRRSAPFRQANAQTPTRESAYTETLALEALLEKPPVFAPLPGAAHDAPPPYGEVRYAGKAFGLFILIEWGEKLYIIDQHAAHERILYNRFLSQPIPKQELLVPIPFSTESGDEDRFLEAKQEELSRLGVEIKKDGRDWRIEALPADWRLGDAETIKEILELRKAGENMAERWAAALCCHQAVKDGDYLDDAGAFALGQEALALPDPRCPHGRPIWTEISREALCKAVRRL